VSLTEAIKNQFGSKKGLLRFLVYQSLCLLGKYKQQTKIDFTKVTRLVFVCQGNICRSPLGEGIANQLGATAISFGLNTRGGDMADPRAILWAQTQQLDLSSHRTQRIDQYIPTSGDLLIGMEPKHLAQLVAKFNNELVQITLAGLWLKRPLAYLHDPYNATPEFFNRCEIMVAEATKMIVNKLQSKELCNKKK
jgi:protein-tyrosine phosphatase